MFRESDNEAAKTISSANHVHYKCIEKGTTHRNASFQKYKAYKGEQHDVITVREWAEIVAAAGTGPQPKKNQKNSETTTTPPTSTTTTAEAAVAIDNLNQIMSNISYHAFFFETPGVTDTLASQIPFEFVLVDAPSLHLFASKRPMWDAFSQACSKDAKMENTNGSVFPNLSGDAMLIVPKPLPSGGNHDHDYRHYENYTHLAAFVRSSAPRSQVHHIWQMTAQAYLDRLSLHDNTKQRRRPPPPVWLSTSGMGVAWLHFRLDTTPKYYTYKPYKQVVAITKNDDDDNDNTTCVFAT